MDRNKLRYIHVIAMLLLRFIVTKINASPTTYILTYMRIGNTQHFNIRNLP